METKIWTTRQLLKVKFFEKENQLSHLLKNMYAQGPRALAQFKINECENTFWLVFVKEATDWIFVKGVEISFFVSDAVQPSVKILPIINVEQDGS